MERYPHLYGMVMDAVITWVDGSDPDHIARRHASAQHLSREGLVHQEGVNLYRDFGQLRYLLRSLALYAPWLGTIYIIASNPPPYWLDRTHPRLRWISHEEIFPDKRDLPTFSSRAIECHLHQILGLSQHFVYFNDDFALVSPTSASDFFTTENQLAEGRPICYVNTQFSIKDFPENKLDVYGSPIRRADELLDQYFYPRRRHPLSHAPYAIDKGIFEEIYTLFFDEFAVTSAAPFRSPLGIDPLYLYAHYAIEIGGESRIGDGMIYFPFTNDRAYNQQVYRHILKDVASGKHKFLCLNDAIEDDILAVGIADDLEGLYERLFPAPSPFERFSS